MLAVVLLGLLATSPDVTLFSEPNPAAPIVAQAIPNEALRPFDYNKFGVAVYSIRGDWYYVSIGKQKAWLRKTPQMQYHLYLDLLTRRAPLLARNWDAKIYAKIGHNPVVSQKLKQALRGRRSVGARILSQHMYHGALWFQIQTPAPDACGELPPNIRPTTGWIPAHDPDGEPNLWFSSMGC